jgi:hypothetical protein
LCLWLVSKTFYLLSPIDFLTSSAEAIESEIPIHMKARALQTAELSAFSSAAVLLINHSHHLAWEYHVKNLLGLSQSGVTVALNTSIQGSSVIIL